ncbi:uncharacterized protein N7446_011133 [Penicillium canescens]|uniref:uncharacterized protein n=1 Tax=Penicillium canescens TaxID=5083 RepID=UPI0026DEA6EC|nr:uncharacterized protein N7446_011133 [Penicillium canescens]KAJ6048450.1 hypothetical protein N7446_011133 [Penicillium canescens]
MAAILPPELLHQIAELLQNNRASLVPCTSVCRLWRAAFEPLIYHSLAVYSDDEHKQEGQRGISLANLQKITSGDRAVRQTWIRNLEYHILTPYELLDWTTRKESNAEAYCIDNPIRKANDIAFQAAMVNLFQELHSWNQSFRVKLDLGVRGRRGDPAPEPHTEDWDGAGEYLWDYKDGRSFSTPPYRARFLSDMPDLASVPCVEKLSFINENWPGGTHHQIWTGAIQIIIQRCPTIYELALNLDEWVRPDPLDIRVSYQFIPKSLQVLDYEREKEENWKQTLSPLNVIPSGIDSMSINLRDLSVNLRELKFKNSALAYDFMCPLDGEGKPELGSLHWPHLKILEVEYVRPWLPSGEPTYHYTAEDQAEINQIDDWDWEICDLERGWLGPTERIEEHFHRLLISMGYAAQRMPSLKSLRFEIQSENEFILYFRNTADEITLGWECYPEYQPDERVAKAWNIDPDDSKVDFAYQYDASVALKSWPPEPHS